MIEIEPGLGVGAPGVLDLQKQMTQQGDVGRITDCKLSLSDPSWRRRATSRYRATFSGSLATPWIHVSPISLVTTGSDAR